MKTIHEQSLLLITTKQITNFKEIVFHIVKKAGVSVEFRVTKRKFLCNPRRQGDLHQMKGNSGTWGVLQMVTVRIKGIYNKIFLRSISQSVVWVHVYHCQFKSLFKQNNEIFGPSFQTCELLSPEILPLHSEWFLDGKSGWWSSLFLKK